MTSNLNNLGIIEGFYGKPWSFSKRQAYIPFMQKHGYSFYLYAPKADRFLREDWQQPTPAPLLDKLKALGEQFNAADIKWGIGLSPFDLHQDFNTEAKKALSLKLNQLKSLGINWLAILFDDMRGDFPDLAQRQIEICHFIRDYISSDVDEHSGVTHELECVNQHKHIEKLLMCPSYYCFDPILETVFGKMPGNYLEDLGKGLDSNIDIFWTGEKVCSQEYSLNHLKQLESILQRKPFIWDNYPVNDGARMSPFLHLSQWSDRATCRNANISGLAANPMNEAFLSQIALAGMSHSVNDAKYDVGLESFKKWSDHFLSKASEPFKADRHLFEELGLLNLDVDTKQALIEKYENLKDETNQFFIDELLDYLKGHYLSDVNDQVPTQLLWES